jgi:1-hydroxycarotenoid 3,4-desaturase
VVIVGGGLAGLCAAAGLSHRGLSVVVLEAADRIGGKARTLEVAGRSVATGPTVVTLRPILEAAFEEAGGRLDAAVSLERLDVLARHAWTSGGRLDLHADPDRSAEAIADLSGAAEADGYRRFLAHVRRIYETVEGPFILSERPTVKGLLRHTDMRTLIGLSRIDATRTMHAALKRFFRDPRLRQLFGRYATYCGGSPYLAPATFGLVAHVEQAGVFRVDGGVEAIADALADRARASGARLRCHAPVAEILAGGGRAAGVRLADGEILEAGAVIVAADVAAVLAGRFGPTAAAAVGGRPAPRTTRSLSALTLALVEAPSGFALSHHNVFFGPDDAAEFDALFGKRRMPERPTVYVCAQDRGAEGAFSPGPERLLCILNAPADGDLCPPGESEIERWVIRALKTLEACGLHLGGRPEAMAITTPSDFEARFPATGGALYGPAPHGMRAAFTRMGTTTRLPGLYLAGGSVHPGAGVPLAIQSGRLAVHRLLSDRASTSRSRRGAMAGGTSTS